MINRSRQAPCFVSPAVHSTDYLAQGSVFVEFTDFKSVEAFLNADPKPSWNGEELKIMTKYVAESGVHLCCGSQPDHVERRTVR